MLRRTQKKKTSTAFCNINVILGVFWLTDGFLVNTLADLVSSKGIFIIKIKLKNKSKTDLTLTAKQVNNVRD